MADYESLGMSELTKQKNQKQKKNQDQNDQDRVEVIGSNNTAATEEECTREELTELIRAIKFAKPEASMRFVHREISEDLSQKEGFGFLNNVKLNDVKRVWKKALSSPSSKEGGQEQQQQQHHSTIEELDNADDGVMKLYTVGDGTVRTLAKEYSQAAATQAAKEATAIDQIAMENYVHLFLDVPADRSGSRPHQALISFNDNRSNSKSVGKDPSNKKRKSKGKKGIAKAAQNNHDENNERGEIVKIQIAAPPAIPGENAGVATPKYPMLLYNIDRTQRTFIHADPQDDGYEKIQKWILNEGIGGALGSVGGTKSYFYSRLTKSKTSPDVISVDISGVAPPQTW